MLVIFFYFTGSFILRMLPLAALQFRQGNVGIFIRIDAVDVNRGQRLFANEIILVQARQRKA